MDSPAPTSPSGKAKPIPERFRVSKTTLWFDKFMTGTIITGGLLVIIAVLGIFFFILSETIPLFGGAKVQEAPRVSLTLPKDAVLGMDDKGEWTFLFANDSDIDFVRRTDSHLVRLPLPGEIGALSASSYTATRSALALATANGQVGLLDIKFGETPSLSARPFHPLLEENDGGKILSISYTDAGEKKIFAAIRDLDGKRRINLMTLEESRSLLSEGELAPGGHYDLTALIEGTPVKILVSSSGTGAVVLNDADTVFYLEYDEEEDSWLKRQTLTAPLGAGEHITVLDWVFGEMSLTMGGSRGSLKVFSLFPQTGQDGSRLRLFGETRSFPAMQGAVTLYISSQINRSFFVATDTQLRLCYSTTEDIRWEKDDLSYHPAHMTASGHFNTLAVEDKTGGLHFYGISDPFPEAGLNALFGKVWYEGYDSPTWQWQSVGGTDDYEPKISLMPLIFGTLKGTFYALLFAVPVALLAAVYTSHFMSPTVKRIVKPTMEIMASLPSVVLGFFGALYMAPLMEDKAPAFIAMGVIIPLVTIALGWLWISLPIEFRNKFKGGFEYLVMIPVMLLTGWLCWTYLGDMAEQPLVHTARGIMTAFGAEPFEARTFPDLWRNGFGLPYEQRNSLVVGFVMGFAVIPVIFTIAEDALSNVPPSLISASEALGASRWQIVRTIVLPVAAAGIFSALMIGVGRAVGETMIVLMATGNTPIMDWNIFNGMRTLSANIATELPEAAEHSTHYRVLFLGGLILFMMTFVLNTIAEIFRNRLREKFKIV